MRSLTAAIYAILYLPIVTILVFSLNSAPNVSAFEGFSLLWPFWVMLVWGIPLVAQALYVLRQPLLGRARRHRPRPPARS